MQLVKIQLNSKGLRQVVSERSWERGYLPSCQMAGRLIYVHVLHYVVFTSPFSQLSADQVLFVGMIREG